MPCNALARINATIARPTLIAALFQSPDTTAHALTRVLQQIEGVLAVTVQVQKTTLTIAFVRHGTPYRTTVRHTTGKLSLVGGDVTFLDQLRSLVEELGGTLVQERLVRTLTTTFGSRVAEVAAPSRVRRLTVRL